MEKMHTEMAERLQNAPTSTKPEVASEESGFLYPEVTNAKGAKKTSFLGSFRRYLPIIAFDLIALTLVLVLTYELVNSKLVTGLFNESKYLALHIDRVIFYASIVFLTLVTFNWNGLYQHSVLTTRVKQFALILRSVLITGVVVVLFSFLFLNSTISESFKDFLLSFTVLGTAIVFGVRMIFRYLIKNNLKLSTLKPANNTIIIGAGQAAKLYAANVANSSENHNLVFLDDDETKIGQNILGYKVEGKPEDVVFKAITFGADQICIIINNITKERLLEILQFCKRTGLPTKVLSSHYNLMFTGMYDKSDDLLGTIPLETSTDNRIDKVCKRVIDLVVASLATLALLIPGLIIALMVKLSSKGPVFHKSYRVGERGHLFKMIKFRSMRVNAEYKHQQAAVERLKNGMHMGKVDSDPRITKLGAILRKYSLDELPQLLNVLKGEMSLVGPRPCFEYEMKLFEEWHNRRFLMKPGITGLWQITGRQMSDLLLNDAMTTDVFYTDNFSIWMDIRILFKTIPVVVNGKGR